MFIFNGHNFGNGLWSVEKPTQTLGRSSSAEGFVTVDGIPPALLEQRYEKAGADCFLATLHAMTG
jgi:hypothetical protein